MKERKVKCLKLGIESPGLASPPFEDALGQEIYEHVSLEAWKMWTDDMMIKVINEYRLNLADADQYNVLLDQMRAFLNLPSATEASDSSSAGVGDVLEVGNAERGRGES